MTPLASYNWWPRMTLVWERSVKSYTRIPLLHCYRMTSLHWQSSWIVYHVFAKSQLSYVSSNYFQYQSYNTVTNGNVHTLCYVAEYVWPDLVSGSWHDLQERDWCGGLLQTKQGLFCCKKWLSILLINFHYWLQWLSLLLLMFCILQCVYCVVESSVTCLIIYWLLQLVKYNWLYIDCCSLSNITDKNIILII